MSRRAMRERRAKMWEGVWWRFRSAYKADDEHKRFPDCINRRRYLVAARNERRCLHRAGPVMFRETVRRCAGCVYCLSFWEDSTHAKARVRVTDLLSRIRKPKATMLPPTTGIQAIWRLTPHPASHTVTPPHPPAHSARKKRHMPKQTKKPAAKKPTEKATDRVYLPTINVRLSASDYKRAVEASTRDARSLSNWAGRIIIASLETKQAPQQDPA